MYSTGQDLGVRVVLDVDTAKGQKPKASSTEEYEYINGNQSMRFRYFLCTGHQR